MEKPKKKRGPIIVLFVVVVVGFILLFEVEPVNKWVSERFIKKEKEVETFTEIRLEKIVQSSDLSTLEYTYNAITPVENKDGEVKYYVAYEGEVDLGFDITKVDIVKNDDSKTITVTLPDVAFQDFRIDPGKMEFIFVDSKYETETVSEEAYRESLANLKQEAPKDDKLVVLAKDNAIISIKALLDPWVQQAHEDYTLEVR